MSRHTRGPKRGQCGNCPAIKGLAIVQVAPGRKLLLCVECRIILRGLQKREDAKTAQLPPSEPAESGDQARSTSA